MAQGVVVRDSNGTALGNISVRFYYRDESQAGSNWVLFDTQTSRPQTTNTGRAWSTVLVPNYYVVKAVAGGTGTDYQETESGYLTIYDEVQTSATLIAAGQTIDFPANTQPGSMTVTINSTSLAYTGSAQTLATCSAATGTYYLGYRGPSSTINSGTGQYVFEGNITWGSANVSTVSGTYPLCYEIWAKCNASTGYEAVSEYKVGEKIIGFATGTAPTFSNQSKSVTLVPTDATTSPAVNCGAFTQATAGHGGSIKYIIQSVKNNNNVAQSGWTLNGNTGETTSRVITVPAQTAGGTYTVVVRAIERKDYYNDSTKDATITVTVTKATGFLTGTKASGTLTYNKSAQTIETVNTYSGDYYFGLGSSTTSAPTSWGTKNTACSVTNAGTYYVWGKCDASNYASAVSAKYLHTVTINQAGVTVSWGTVTWTYDKQSHSTTCSISSGVISGDTCTVSLSGNSVGPNVGTATVTASLSNSNYKISSGGSSKTLTINAKAASFTWGTITWTYDGSAHSTTCAVSNLETGDTCTVTLTGNSVGPAVGSATVTASSLSNSNYKLPSAKTKSISVTARVVTLSWGTLSWPYDGSTHSTTCTVSNLVSGTTCTVTLTGNSVGANVGTATVTASSLSNTNYTLTGVANSDKSKTLSITQITGGVTISNASQAYKSGGNLASVSGATGTMHYKLDSGSWSTSIPTATSSVNAGNHTLYYYVDASTNYTAFGTQSSPKSLTVTVSKVTPVVSTNPTKVSNWTYDKTAHNLLSGGAYKHSSSDTTAVAGSFAYAQATNAGSYTSLTWTFTPTDTTNYNTATGSITGTVTVSPKGVTTQWGVLTWTYDGLAHSTTCGLVSGGVISGDTCTISLSGNSVGPNVGTATVTATLSNSNYTISSGGSSQTLTITQRTVTVTAPSKKATTFTYTGSAQTLFNAGSCTTGGVMYYNTSNTRFSTSTWTTTFPDTSKTNAGTYTWYYYCYVSDTTNNTGTGINTSTQFSATINPAAGSVGTVATIADKTFSTSAQTVNLRMTGNTGTVTYPSSITVKNSSNTTISGWTISSGTVTIPASTTVDTYTITGSVTCAASSDGNYTAVTTGQSRTWTVTINKADISPTVSMSGYTYGGTKSTPSVSGNSGNGTVTYYYNTTNSNTGGTAWSNVTSSTSLNAGTYYMYATIAATTNYNGATTPAVAFTIAKATGSSGSVSNPAAQTYKTSGTYSFTLGITGATGTVTYPSSFSVNSTTWSCNTSTGVVTVPAGTNAGSYTLTGNITVAESTNYNAVSATSKSWTVTIDKATGSVGTASNPAAKTFSTSSQTAQLAMTGNTGTVTYPTSITVKDSSNNTVTGWSCTSAGVVTIPASTTVGSYTVTGNVTCAASTNYNAVTTGQSRSWTITINKATGSSGSVSNPASQTYKTSGTYSFQLGITGATGTVTYPTSITVKQGSTTITGWSCTSAGVVTVPASTNAASYTVTGNITVAASTNYNAVSATSKTWTVTIDKATGSSGSVSNPAAKTFSTSSQTAQLSITGATGTVTYPTSITVKDSSNNTVTGWSCTSAGVVTIPASTTVGSYTVTGNITVAASTNYNAVSATSKTWTITINKATGSSGSVSNPAAKTFSTSSQTAQLGITGATGTVTYPTSITVKNSSNTTISGWSCTSAGVVTIPASTTVDTYTVTGNITVAASTNYNAVSATSKTWTITINKASNQITVSPTTVTVYYRSGYTNATVTVSNYKGTVTAVSSNTGKITVSPASSTSGTFTVAGVAAGSATITFTDTSTNYATSTATCSVTCAQDSVSSVSVSVGTKSLSVGGTSAITVTAHYASGYSPNVTSSATYSSSPTNKVAVVKGATAIGLWVDCGLENDYGFIHWSGYQGIREWYDGEGYLCDKYFVAAGTITYGGSTKYLWQNTDTGAVSEGAPAYIVTNSNDVATLLGLSVKYNLNNIFTNSIVATLTSDRSTYESPTNMRIWDVDV